jgi:hypothetical protein
VKPQDVLRHMSELGPDEEVICVWFSKEDFPLGVRDDGEYETLALAEWNDVVSIFESEKWTNPLNSSWADVHQDIYKLVGEKLGASV